MFNQNESGGAKASRKPCRKAIGGQVPTRPESCFARHSARRPDRRNPFRQSFAQSGFIVDKFEPWGKAGESATELTHRHHGHVMCSLIVEPNLRLRRPHEVGEGTATGNDYDAAGMNCDGLEPAKQP